jgi:hypothetical protein
MLMLMLQVQVQVGSVSLSLVCDGGEANLSSYRSQRQTDSRQACRWTWTSEIPPSLSLSLSLSLQQQHIPFVSLPSRIPAIRSSYCATPPRDLLLLLLLVQKLRPRSSTSPARYHGVSNTVNDEAWQERVV